MNGRADGCGGWMRPGSDDQERSRKKEKKGASRWPLPPRPLHFQPHPATNHGGAKWWKPAAVLETATFGLGNHCSIQLSYAGFGERTRRGSNPGRTGDSCASCHWTPNPCGSVGGLGGGGVEPPLAGHDAGHEAAVLTGAPHSVLKGVCGVLRGCGPHDRRVRPSLWVLTGNPFWTRCVASYAVLWGLPVPGRSD